MKPSVFVPSWRRFTGGSRSEELIFLILLEKMNSTLAVLWASSESWLLTLSSCCLCDRNNWANVTIYDWDYCECEDRVKYKRRGSSVWSLCFLDVINQRKHLRVIIICCSTENDHFALRNQAASASKVIICFRNCAVLILLAMLWVFFILVKSVFRLENIYTQLKDPQHTIIGAGLIVSRHFLTRLLINNSYWRWWLLNCLQNIFIKSQWTELLSTESRLQLDCV